MKFLYIALLLAQPFWLFSQPNTVIKTDSSVIETNYYKDLNSISTFNQLNNSTKVYYRNVYFSTKKIDESGTFTEHRSTGIWRKYSITVKLIREIDHDKAVIRYIDKKAYPMAALQHSMKLKGDRILTAIYGPAFIAKHVIWSIDGSYIGNEDESDDWTGALKKPPKTFLLRYTVVFDNKKYPDFIEFEIDTKGHVLPNEANEAVYGFEKRPKLWPQTFTLTANKALELAKKKGMTETASTKASSFLHWEKNTSNSLYSGRFMVYESQRIQSINEQQAGGRSQTVDKYIVYTFNPWTAEFIEQKKMKVVRSRGEISGYTTGLLPDK